MQDDPNDYKSWEGIIHDELIIHGQWFCEYGEPWKEEFKLFIHQELSKLNLSNPTLIDHTPKTQS